MKQTSRKWLVALVSGVMALSAHAQKDKNYYTQIIHLADGTESRLLPDEISRISVISTEDWSQMTVTEFLNYCKEDVDSAAVWAHDMNTEAKQWEVWVPNNEAWREAQNSMKPYYKSVQSTVALNIEQMTSPSNYVSVHSPVNPEECASRRLAHEFETPVTEGVVAARNVVNGKVTIISSVPKNYWFHNLELKNWQNLCHTNADLADNATYKYDGIKGFNCTFDSVRTAENMSYITARPITSRGKPDVFVRLPQPLSATYDLYCAVVPENSLFEDVSEAKPNCLNFQLYYGDENGELTTWNFSSNGETNPATVNMTTAFINDASKVDTLYLGRFSFPAAYDGHPVNISPVLRITCPISSFNSEQLGTYTRTLRLAAIMMHAIEQN